LELHEQSIGRSSAVHPQPRELAARVFGHGHEQVVDAEGDALESGPGQVRAAVDALNLGRAGAGLPSTQLPAFFVVAADGTVKYARYGTSITEQPDIEALWAASAP
jgi:hypothetical protein